MAETLTTDFVSEQGRYWLARLDGLTKGQPPLSVDEWRIFHHFAARHGATAAAETHDPYCVATSRDAGTLHTEMHLHQCGKPTEHPEALHICRCGFAWNESITLDPDDGYPTQAPA